MNVKVVLVHDGMPDDMKRSMSRVISESQLHAATVEGRFAEARALYARMMGIKSTTHQYECVETTEPPYQAPEIPKSEIAALQKSKEEEMLGKMSTLIADGIAKGVASALAAQGSQTPSTKKAPKPLVDPEPELDEIATDEQKPKREEEDTGTMRTPKRRRRADL